jgi:hypothetical protein
VVWNLPEASWGTVNAAFFIGFALGGPILARIARSFGPRRTLCGAIALLAVSLAAWAYLPVEQGVALACAFTFCAGLGASAMSIAVGVAVRAVPVESAGAASGLVVSSMACSGMVIQAAAMAKILEGRDNAILKEITHDVPACAGYAPISCSPASQSVSHSRGLQARRKGVFVPNSRQTSDPPPVDGSTNLTQHAQQCQTKRHRLLQPTPRRRTCASPWKFVHGLPNCCPNRKSNPNGVGVAYNLVRRQKR